MSAMTLEDRVAELERIVRILSSERDCRKPYGPVFDPGHNMPNRFVPAYSPDPYKVTCDASAPFINGEFK